MSGYVQAHSQHVQYKKPFFYVIGAANGSSPQGGGHARRIFLRKKRSGKGAYGSPNGKRLPLTMVTRNTKGVTSVLLAFKEGLGLW